MNEVEVVELIKSSKTEQEWNDNCDTVKEKCSGYTDFWFSTIVQSGIAKATTDSFNSSVELRF